AITDYVVSRAGSNAIFEFLALRIPMLLIPLSLAASRGDQIVNAESFKKKQYAHVLPEEDLTGAIFTKKVFKLIDAVPVMREHMTSYKSAKVPDEVMQIIKEESK